MKKRTKNLFCLVFIFLCVLVNSIYGVDLDKMVDEFGRLPSSITIFTTSAIGYLMCVLFFIRSEEDKV